MSKNTEKVSIQELANNFYWFRTVENYQNLYLRLHWGIRTYLYKYLQDIDDCNDVTIGVFEKVWSKMDMYDPMKSNFSTWLYRVARNDALLFLKNKQKTTYKHLPNDISNIYSNALVDDSTTLANIQEELLCDNIFENAFDRKSYGEVIDEMYDVSIRSIHKLPDNFKLALTEQLINKKSIEQIAYDNNIKKTTVVNWIYQGRQALKNIIKTEFKELYDDYVLGSENYMSM
jgi:RNA polymerase sigma factor (sigma-70 family)